PQPEQPDPNIVPCYAGDYNYHSAYGTTGFTTWTDGRVAISGHQQQDVFFDKQSLVVPATCGPESNYTAASSSGNSIVPGTTDIGNHCDDCTTGVTLPFPFTLYDRIFTDLDVSSNGRIDYVTPNANFTNNCLPDTFADYTLFPH